MKTAGHLLQIPSAFSNKPQVTTEIEYLVCAHYINPRTESRFLSLQLFKTEQY